MTSIRDNILERLFAAKDDGYASNNKKRKYIKCICSYWIFDYCRIYY